MFTEDAALCDPGFYIGFLLSRNRHRRDIGILKNTLKLCPRRLADGEGNRGRTVDSCIFPSGSADEREPGRYSPVCSNDISCLLCLAALYLAVHCCANRGNI